MSDSLKMSSMLIASARDTTGLTRSISYLDLHVEIDREGRLRTEI